MKTLVIATANKHKLDEFKKILTDFNLMSLSDINFFGDIAEDGSTLEENAQIKAETIFKFCKEKGLNFPVVADDTGLFVNSLGGEPGIYSARYSDAHNDEANRQKLLKKLSNSSDRSAYFETCLCFFDDDGAKFFTGKTEGKITKQKIGDESFGYDCIFYSNDLNKTFGEASNEEKNSVSHRGRAVKNLKNWLSSQK